MPGTVDRTAVGRPCGAHRSHSTTRHTKLENTVRYLGIEIDDALEVAEQTEV